ncbi:MAG: glycerol-3-phosphate 1-O-acyltransferase PlsY [Lachnospiraceae bacterium]|nr:glycerol-3-phosphate 1-O-acyltransferase PlsY [Lachnospiraceae bacterium]
MFRLFALLIGYCFGLFQTSYFIGRSKGIDIRTKGSGNAGMTNTLRVFGGKAAVLVLFCDALKCILSVVIARILFCRVDPGLTAMVSSYAAFGAVLGHVFPFYMHFKGGKGVACTCGAGMIFCVPSFLISVVLFLGIVFGTGYVSLGSLAATLTFLITYLIFDHRQMFGIQDTHFVETAIVTAGIVALIWFKHRANIKRLLSGTENKTHLGPKKKEE